MVKPRGGVPRDIEVTGRGLSFKSLRQEGWTKNPPTRTSLDDRYKYIRSDGHPNGAVGLDYFLGEKAVLTSTQMFCEVAHGKPFHRAPPLSVRLVIPRPINLPLHRTSSGRTTYLILKPLLLVKQQLVKVLLQLMLHVNLHAVLNRRTIRQPARRSVATTASFRATPPCSPCRSSSASPPIAATTHVADEAFEIEDNDLASSPEEVDNEDSAEDALRSELLADTHDDLSVAESSGGADQYEAIGSGDEAERGDVDLGEYDSVQSVYAFIA
ncbi:hypothetical protein GN958_ATG11083 [Phytophthora infestans]|uniref:Uncharacterized protein n=1 Tax=Phytophthora infestans TaxID=4787 RepID=A0A8S9UMK4_PHYIN|nr:hypothetical protein GN958_ATG11083 [Phytophthora infestans]